jgi:hypothetical protein
MLSPLRTCRRWLRPLVDRLVKRTASLGQFGALLLWPFQKRMPRRRRRLAVSARFRPDLQVLEGLNAAGSLLALGAMAPNPSPPQAAAVREDGFAAGSWGRKKPRKPRAGRRTLGLANFSSDGMQTSPDGRWLATRSIDGRVRLWDLGGARPVEVGPWQDGPVEGWPTAFSPDGVLATYQTDKFLRLWDLVGTGPRQSDRYRGVVNQAEARPHERDADASRVRAEVRLQE